MLTIEITKVGKIFGPTDIYYEDIPENGTKVVGGWYLEFVIDDVNSLIIGKQPALNYEFIGLSDDGSTPYTVIDNNGEEHNLPYIGYVK